MSSSDLPGHDIFCTPENSSFVYQVPYQSLSTTDKEIRLLRILPDYGSGLVDCELLSNVKLADVENKYLALSYCAGSAKNIRYISVNGAKCNVFANLHHALKEARHYWEIYGDKKDFLLWVDQICINQFDLAERSHQVSFMRNIYENAKETLICLSTAEANKGEEIGQLVKLRDVLERYGCNKSYNEFDKFYLANENNRAEVEKGLAAFFEVGKSPWWGRAWVFQEFIVSEQAIFLQGMHSIPYLELIGLIRSFKKAAVFPCRGFKNSYHSLVRPRVEKDKAASRMWMLLVAKSNLRRTNDLKMLLALTKDSQATDARDKLYSILGLARPGYGIVPDYSVNTNIHNLLVETTKRIILFDDSLEVLSYKNRRKTSHPGVEVLLPSWVLDWTDSTSLGQILDRGLFNVISIDMEDDDPYQITKTSADAFFLQVSHPQNPEAQITVMQIWGIFLDNDFKKTTVHSHLQYFEGARKYEMEVTDGIQVGSDCELWGMYGSKETFLLCRYSNGYRVVAPVFCSNLEEQLELVPGVVKKREINISKMQKTRITIF
ncbi:hypothetical protein FPOA_06439 [Fusarium poae]|uniref:Heterokaryon incompatibility domain-containing protein n=1 Tax=Fusarium poae TaxID=36050 RepID=A0A1B8AZH4_FUSPO|nr:hypothetical protein FPOA_06439 [Fusarium poae]